VDSSGNVVVTGYFHGHIDMDWVANPGQHFLDTSNAPNDNGSGYVVKLDPSGNFVWEAQAAGESGTTAFAIAVDSDDNVYTLGNFGNHTWFNDRTANNGNPPNANSLSLYDSSNRDVLYVWKLTADGLNARVTQLEQSANTLAIFGLGIAVDSADSVYVAGAFSGTGFDFDIGVSQPGDTIDSAGGHDVFVDKLDSSGHYQWVRRAGDVGDDWGTGIALDDAGNPYVTGYITADALFGNILLTPASPDGNSFIAQLDPAGNFLCAHASADLAPAGDRAAAIAVDGDGYVDVVGTFTGAMQFGDLPQLTSAGGDDAFVIKTKLECSPVVPSVIDGHILKLLGDNRPNKIQVIDDRHWGILVYLDDDAPRAYTGPITRIEADTRGGDDQVLVSLGGPDTIGDPDFLVPDVLVDLGAGNDAASIQIDNPDFIGNPDLLVAVDAGGGYDTVDIQIGNPDFIDSPDLIGNPELRVAVDAGAGNDLVRIDFAGSVSTMTTVDLGKGDDVFASAFKCFTPSNPHAMAVMGGTGQNRITVEQICPPAIGYSPGDPLSAPDTLTIDGSLGTNVVEVKYDFDLMATPPDGTTPAFTMPLLTSIRGGDHGDDIRVSYGITFGGSEGPPDVILAAPITLDIDGAGGTDNIVVDVAHQPGPLGERIPATFIFATPVAFDIRGGAGNDTMSVNVGPGDPTALAGPAPINRGTFRLRLDGEDGNDTALVALTFNGQSTGSVDAQVLGGRGNDDLTLGIGGVGGFPVFFPVFATIDGGDGIDTAHHTANVRVVNCER
jgi:hypothetical protein